MTLSDDPPAQLPAIIPPAALTTAIDTYLVPALVAAAGDAAGWRYVEFFTANIRNPNTRRAYARACGRFFTRCDDRGLTLTTIRPFDVAARVTAHDEALPIGPGNASPRTRWRGSGCNVTYSEGTAWPVVLPHPPSPNRQSSPLDRSGVVSSGCGSASPALRRSILRKRGSAPRRSSSSKRPSTEPCRRHSGTARRHTCGTIRPRHSTPAPLLQMPRFAAPFCVQLVDQEDTMRRFTKRANIFQRTRSGPSPCSAQRSAHLKTKSPMRNRS